MEMLLEPTSNMLLVAYELTDAVGKPFEVLNNVFEHWVFNSLVHSFCALSALRRSSLRTASIAAKPCQGDSLEFYLITGRIPTVVAAGQKYVNSQLHAHTSNSLSMTAKRPTTQLPQLESSRVDNFVPNKHVKASVRTKLITVSHPHVITKKDEEIDVVSETNDVLPPSDDSDDEVDVVGSLRVDNVIQEHEYLESEDSDLDNPLLPLPPPEPSDKEFDFEINFEKEISVMRNLIVKFECIDTRMKFDVFNAENDVFKFIMFSLLSAESEDTIFDPGLSPKIEDFLCRILSWFSRPSFSEVKTANTLMETSKPLLKDKDGQEVDVHMYRSMIGSLMYLTSSSPDIMFAVRV
nr:hypothetical protein [Tanacetum cinerariifolium]